MAQNSLCIVRPTLDPANPAAEQGFTLLEVMVALAIAVPTLLLIYRQSGVSLEMTRSASLYAEALSRAQSRLDAVLDTTLDARDREGDEGNNYHWHTRIVPITTVRTKTDGGRRSTYSDGVTLYAVTVEVSWRGQRGVDHVTLATRLAGPAAESIR